MLSESGALLSEWNSPLDDVIHGSKEFHASEQTTEALDDLSCRLPPGLSKGNIPQSPCCTYPAIMSPEERFSQTFGCYPQPWTMRPSTGLLEKSQLWHGLPFGFGLTVYVNP